MRFSQRLAAVTLASIGFAAPVSAQDTDPGESILLTVTDPGLDSVRTYDREALMTLDETTFETSTIWTEGLHSFTGIELADLTEALGVTDGTLLATAINEYSVEIPVSDAVEDGPIIAYLMDGEQMSVRDKGPLWLVYPYDSDADYRTEVIYSRSIWQLDRIQVAR